MPRDQVILLAHVAPHCMDGAAVDTPARALIGGMHGARWYTRTRDCFAMDRPNWVTRIAHGPSTRP
jgi:hypothetical protein